MAALSVVAGLVLAAPASAYEGLITKQSFEMDGPYTTVGGETIAKVRVGFETIGNLNAAGDNAILVPHFFSGSSHFAGRYKDDDKARGYWDAIVGSGKALDTDKYFLIGVDSLANLNTKDGITVTTGPASIDPATAKPYGMRFPQVQIRDFVNVQKALLDKLGVRKLHAVIGASMGAMQAYEWAAAYPGMVDRIIAVIPGATQDAYGIERLRHWRQVITLDPKWNGGDYYGGPEPMDGLTMALRLITLDALAPEWGESQGRKWAEADKDPAKAMGNAYAVQGWFDKAAGARAALSDANHLIYLARACELFQVGGKSSLEEGLRAIRAKTLLLPSRNDQLLYAEATRKVRDLLAAQGTPVAYQELDGPMGHLNGVGGIAQANDRIARFLAQ
ncbi:homoserine acetyltransferase [Paramagnetospirillum kuznetsovii]|uniref:Probable acyltransferase n=2 Tax=Paramagnetospirillum kuznetsovii TaxID=2053833 RepID=A0A364NU54_9PROT|nr:homoserine acetyltransferase [Paramagnetospirillum kuznetsovii]